MNSTPVNPHALSSLASDYAKDMTSIRGRRVQRLLKREFAGADHVLRVRLDLGQDAVLGLSASGAALCATDGTGKQASVFKWAHDSADALEMQFDLHKDSLPVLASESIPIARLRARARVLAPVDVVPSGSRAWLSKVLEALK